VCNQRRNQESTRESSRAHARESECARIDSTKQFLQQYRTVISRKLSAKLLAGIGGGDRPMRIFFVLPRHDIFLLMETASTKYCSLVREKAEIG
jgi:hypothetical protein